MPNYSLKPGRGPSAMNVVGGVFGVLFGIFWTVMAYKLTRDAPMPIVSTLFPLFGVFVVIASIVGVFVNLHNATQPNRFSLMDVVESGSEPEPFSPHRADTQSRPLTTPAGYCTACGGPLRPGDRFCGKCGKAASGANA